MASLHIRRSIIAIFSEMSFIYFLKCLLYISGLRHFWYGTFVSFKLLELNKTLELTPTIYPLQTNNYFTQRLTKRYQLIATSYPLLHYQVDTLKNLPNKHKPQTYFIFDDIIIKYAGGPKRRSNQPYEISKYVICELITKLI